MTKRSILSLACKIIGVIFLAEAVVAVPSVIQFAIMYVRGTVVDGGNPVAYVLFSVCSLVLSFAIAFVLICSSDWIARILIAEDQEIALPDVRERGKAILEPACRIVGIVLLAQAIPGLVRLFSESMIHESIIAGGMSSMRDMLADALRQARVEHWSSLIGYVTSIVIGLCFIFFATYLSTLLYPNESDDASPPECVSTLTTDN